MKNLSENFNDNPLSQYEYKTDLNLEKNFTLTEKETKIFSIIKKIINNKK